MCTASEDFSEFANRVPSVLYFVGAGSKEKESHYPHHSPRFNIDEDAMLIGLEIHVRSALEFLINSKRVILIQSKIYKKIKIRRQPK